MALAPTALTLAILTWMFDVLEETFREPVEALIGSAWYFPGLGILVALALTLIVGVVVNTWMIRSLHTWGESLLKRIPLVKTLYGAILDMVSLFEGSRRKGGRVVRLEIQGLNLIGIVMRDAFDDLPEGLGKDDEVAVFLPLSYQIGGFTVMVPRSQLVPIDMPVDQAIRFAATAGMPGKS